MATLTSLLFRHSFIAFCLKRAPFPFVTSNGTKRWGETQTAGRHPGSATKQVGVWLLSWLPGASCRLSQPQSSVCRMTALLLSVTEGTKWQHTLRLSWCDYCHHGIRPWSPRPACFLPAGSNPLCGDAFPSRKNPWHSHADSVNACVTTWS